MKKILLTTGLVALLTAATAAPTMAISDSGSTPLPGTGAKAQVTARQGSSYADKCSFKTSTLALSPSGTQVSESTRQVSWTTENTWIADPGGSLNTSITTCSDGGAFKSGVKAFASACAND